MKGVYIPKMKDKYGNNKKQHLGLWKYFINTDTMQREKFYINLEGERLIGKLATVFSKKETDPAYRAKMFNQLKSIGREGFTKNNLEFWGLPKGLCDQVYSNTKVRQLFDWQADCLYQNQDAVVGRRNLVYFAPTSGGKSMVSEIIMLKQILAFKKRAMYILPFVSIVAEKELYLSKLCANLNLKITPLHSLSD